MLDRKTWLSLLATSNANVLISLWREMNIERDFTIIRAAEVGSVMVQGRQGGAGSPFHFSEMSVTRCSVKLSTGEIGHGYHQGRSRHAAQIVALADAHAQSEDYAKIEKAIFLPLQYQRQKRRDELAAKAAATKVDFFTLLRGEDD